jgi:hypothetical protein
VAVLNLPVPPVTEAVPRMLSTVALDAGEEACKVSPLGSVNVKLTLNPEFALLAGTLIVTLALPYGSNVPLPERLKPAFRFPVPVTFMFSEMVVVEV